MSKRYNHLEALPRHTGVYQVGDDWYSQVVTRGHGGRGIGGADQVTQTKIEMPKYNAPAPAPAPTAAPEPTPAPTPEPEKEPTGPIEYSNEIKNAFNTINGGGSGFDWNKQSSTETNTPGTDEAYTSPFTKSYQDLLDTGSSGAGTQTPADNPVKDPQLFADKYKLNLIQNGATQA